MKSSQVFRLRVRFRQCLLAMALACVFTGRFAKGDGPADNALDNVRPIPPAGIAVPTETRSKLEASLKELQERIAALRSRKDAAVDRLLPDVEIFSRAVDQALRFNEFFDEREFAGASELLKEGLQRATRLELGDPYWTKQTGLVVRGYRSKLDDTVQPYGLVIPENYLAGGPPLRCDLWFHGRFEKVVEPQFILQRMQNRGEISPLRTIVLHPFGRFSNAFKFAGEVDVWEALEHAQANYTIDPDLIAVRGFSMGGAGAWHFAVHYPDRFFAANPGAGFSETPEFLRVFQSETLAPPAWEQKLWNWYDCPGWVGNLLMIPTIAYSGENDRQKQAADVMAAACEKNGFELTHIIGPKMGHQIDPGSKAEIERRLALINHDGRAIPRNLSFTTWTLRYDRCNWAQIYGLQNHWEASRFGATIEHDVLTVSLDNITDFEVDFPPGTFSPSNFEGIGTIEVPAGKKGARSQTLKDLPKLQSDGSWRYRMHLEDETWKPGPFPATGALRKRHGLQGPIDDAFMESFLFVKPTGPARHPAVGEWAAKELDHAIAHWRQQMRGDARVKADTEITDDDIARHNLILWGDPGSNAVIARIVDRLPIGWTADTLSWASAVAGPDRHVPVLIYPNPLNPDRYVVLNSSFTYREYDYLNNARQTPKLPDWAVIDVSVPPNSRWPGKVVSAGFFSESWEWPKNEVESR